MYLIDTNVISEARKETRANPGVVDFFRQAISSNAPLYLSVITLGELRRGTELMRHRGDADQAARLEAWLTLLVEQYARNILPFDSDAAQVWGRLRVPDPQHALDKQIAAIALVNDLTIVTRNIGDFRDIGAKILNPFQ
jgi:predicted nucleic acid-binding protein